MKPCRILIELVPNMVLLYAILTNKKTQEKSPLVNYRLEKYKWVDYRAGPEIKIYHESSLWGFEIPQTLNIFLTYICTWKCSYMNALTYRGHSWFEWNAGSCGKLCPLWIKLSCCPIRFHRNGESIPPKRFLLHHVILCDQGSKLYLHILWLDQTKIKYKTHCWSTVVHR